MMIRHSSRSRERMAIRVSAEDHMYLEHLREILLAEPCRGVPTEPHQLLNHMYIGNQDNAESLRLLRRLGVTHVLNCAGYKGPRKYPDASPYKGLGIDYLEFKAEDHDLYDIVRHFHEAFSFLDKVHRSGGVALVHCAMGINRSAATCIAYMMHHRNWTLFKVAKIIKDKRRVVLSNKGFQLQLIRFSRNINTLDKLEMPTSRTRESRSREIHHHTSVRDLPPSNYQGFTNNGLPPRARKQKAYVSALTQPITRHEPHVTTYRHNSAVRCELPINEYRRNSPSRYQQPISDYPYRQVRKDGGVDLLSMCINDTLRIGNRSSSVDRFQPSTSTRVY